MAAQPGQAQAQGTDCLASGQVTLQGFFTLVQQTASGPRYDYRARITGTRALPRVTITFLVTSNHPASGLTSTQTVNLVAGEQREFTLAVTPHQPRFSDGDLRAYTRIVCLAS